MPHKLLLDKEVELNEEGWKVRWNEEKTVLEATNRNISDGQKYFSVVNGLLVEEEP